MQAIRLRAPGGLENLYLGSAEALPPAPGEITIRIRASSLNYHDYLVATGVLKTDDARIPMSDGAGEVVAVGADVSEFKIGDIVISLFFPQWSAGEAPTIGLATVPGDGVDGYAREAVTVPAHWFTRAPLGYSPAEAATLSCAGVTAWRALVANGGIKPGDIVLVQGTGGVSIFALQFAKAAGAKVIATSSSDEKLKKLHALGADDLINYRTDPEWGKTARKLTGGRGVDHVVEVGGIGTLEQSLAAVRGSGHISVVGGLAGFSGALPLSQIISKQIRFQGLTVGSRQHQLEMIAGIEATHIRPVIDRHFPLAGIAEAFRYQASGRQFGKIVVDI